MERNVACVNPNSGNVCGDKLTAKVCLISQHEFQSNGTAAFKGPVVFKETIVFENPEAKDSLLPSESKGDLVVHDGTTNTSLEVGANDEVLTADSSAPEGMAWKSVESLVPTTTKGDLLGHNGTDLVRKPVGTTGQVLTADPAESSGVAWQTPTAFGTIPTTTKGDLMVHDGTNNSRKPVGTNGQLLTADSTDPSGVGWGDLDTVLPTTTKGDLMVHDGTNNTRAPVGTDGQVLMADSTNPLGVVWDNVVNMLPSTTKGDIIVHDGTDNIRAPVGANGEVLMADSTNPLGVVWDSVVNMLPTTTKGDLIVHDGSDNIRAPVGTDGQVLMADSSNPLGLVWNSIAGMLPTTTKGDLVVHNGTTNVRAPVGADGEVLVADSSNPLGVIWDSVVSMLPTTTKGDLVVHNGTTNVRTGVGADGEVLTADSSDPAGVSWQASAGGAGNSLSLRFEGIDDGEGGFTGGSKGDYVKAVSYSPGSVKVIPFDPAVKWNLGFGTSGSYDSVAGTGDSYKAIGVDSSGNIYVAGTFNGNITFGSDTLATTEFDSMFVAKSNSTGTWQWAVQTTNGSGGVPAPSKRIAIDDDGNVYVAGTVDGTHTFPELGVSTGEGDSDAFVIKLDGSNGDGIWLTRSSWFGQAQIDQISICCGNGIILATGNFEGDVNFGQEGNQNAIGNRDMFIWELQESNGSTDSWSRPSGHAAGESNRGQSITYHSDGSYILSGSFQGGKDFTIGVSINAPFGSTEFFAAHYPGGGDPANWAVQSLSDEINNIDVWDSVFDAAGNIYIIGSVDGIDVRFGGDGGPSLTTDDLDAFVIKINVIGVIQWVTKISGIRDDYGNGIGIDPNGGIFVVGFSEINSPITFGSGEVILNSNNIVTTWVAKCGADGTWEYVKEVDGPEVNFSECNLSVSPNGSATIFAYGEGEGEGSIVLGDIELPNAGYFVGQLSGPGGEAFGFLQSEVLHENNVNVHFTGIILDNVFGISLEPDTVYYIDRNDGTLTSCEACAIKKIGYALTFNKMLVPITNSFVPLPVPPDTDDGGEGPGEGEGPGGPPIIIEGPE